MALRKSGITETADPTSFRFIGIYREGIVVPPTRMADMIVHPPIDMPFQLSIRSNTKGALIPSVGCNAEGGAQARYLTAATYSPCLPVALSGT